MKTPRFASLAAGLLAVVLVLGLSGCRTTEPVHTQLDDAAITASVKAKLAADPDVAAINVDVDTLEGVVTLSGRVESAQQSNRAEDLARRTDGVKRVVNRLLVGSKT